MKKLCMSVLLLLIAATSTTLFAQVPDCAVRVDRVAFCEDGIDTDFGYEKDDEMVTESCEADCDAAIKFRYRINNGGTMELTNCTLVDSNHAVSGPLEIGTLAPGASVQNIFIETTCSADLDGLEPGTLLATCDCVDSEGFDQTVSAEDSAQVSCVGGTCDNADPFCGDGNLDPGEECDDGNNQNGDGCDANCENEPFCGDGEIDPGEECDDGNNEDGDGCDAGCSIEPFCGDGELQDGEECDDGNNNGGDGCSADCKIEEHGDQGCPTGFWKNNKDLWVGYDPHDLIGSVFTATNDHFPHLAQMTLKDALHFRGHHGNEALIRWLLRHATAALLNAANPDVMFARTEAEIIELTNAAIISCDPLEIRRLKHAFDDENNAGCPLRDCREVIKCDYDRDCKRGKWGKWGKKKGCNKGKRGKRW